MNLKVQSDVSSVVSPHVQMYGLNIYTSVHFLTVNLFDFIIFIMSNKDVFNIMHIHNPLYQPERVNSNIDFELAVRHCDLCNDFKYLCFVSMNGYEPSYNSYVFSGSVNK